MFYLLIYLSHPDSVGLPVDADAAQASTRRESVGSVSDRCRTDGISYLGICFNFQMCVLNLFSFHQPPVYNHPSPIIQSPNSLLANVFCL